MLVIGSQTKVFSQRLAEWIEVVTAVGVDKIIIYKQIHLHPKVFLTFHSHFIKNCNKGTKHNLSGIGRKTFGCLLQLWPN